MIYSQICVNFRILRENGDKRTKGELTRLKEKVGKLELAQDSPKPRLSKSTPVKLGLFSSDSLKQAISRLSEMSHSPSPIRLNRRHEA